MRVQAGELLAITGSSGCGKSTLLHILGALDLPDSGTVKLDGQDVFRMSSGQRDATRNRSGGVRVPVLSPAAGVQRAGERADAADGRHVHAGVV